MTDDITCPKCNHTFKPRGLAHKCPRCKNRLPLDIRMKILKILPREQTCRRCGHTWQPLKKKIKRCPNCNSRLWNKPRQWDHEQHAKIYVMKINGQLYGFAAPYSALV